MQFMRSETDKIGRGFDTIEGGRERRERKKRKMSEQEESVGNLLRMSRREGLSHR